MRSLLRKTLSRLRGRGGRPPERPRVAYVIPVSDEVHNLVRRVEVGIASRRGEDPGIGVSPHITLKQGFDVAALEPHERYFDALAADIAPFDIEVTGVGVFEGGIVFLDVAPDPRLEALRQRILRDLAERFGVVPYALEDHRYHFHATMAAGLTAREVAEVQRALQGERTDFRFRCETLALLYHTGAQWITYKRSALGGGRR
jgi:2'-5' RNA ligase